MIVSLTTKVFFQGANDLILDVKRKRKCVESILRYTDLDAIRVDVPEKE